MKKENKMKIFKNIKNINIVKNLGLGRFTKQTILIVSLALFFVMNFLFSYFSLRLDLSNGRVYTLSQSTKEIVSNLKEKSEITVYVSDNIPARLSPYIRESMDLLKEYERIGGNLKVNVIEFNPDENEDILKQATDNGVVGIPVSEQDQNELSVTQIYFGVVVGYGNSKEPLGEALDIENLEYLVTSALYRMSVDKLPVVATIGGNPNAAFMQQQDPLAALNSMIGKLFDIQPLQETAVSEGGAEAKDEVEVDQNVQALVVYDDPSSDFSEEQIDLIQKYLDSKNSIIFSDGEVVDDQSLQVASGEAKMSSILESRGLKINQDLVLSSQSEMVNLGGNGMSLFIPYPFWIVSSNFNLDTSYFSGIGRLTFPWASSIDFVKKDGFQTKEIVKSANPSWHQTSNFVLDPQQIENPSQSDLKDFTLAAESTSKDGKKLLAVGSSRFINGLYLSNQSQNIEFVLNVLSDYASNGALNGIARRSINVYPLPNMSQSVQEFYKYASILLLPGVFAIYGIYRIWKRRDK